MVDRNIGAVPVLRRNAGGVFSERDLMRRVVVEGHDPARTRVGDVMTVDPLTVSPHEDMETCASSCVGTASGICSSVKPVKLKGMVSMRDILLHDLSEKDDEVRMMRAYIHSVP